MKYDLKVIILKGFVLLPNNELKIDIKIDKNVLDSSELFNDNNILVVTDIDALEETTNLRSLPRIGTIAKITQKLELPNNLIRLTLTGVIRADVEEYIEDKNNEIDAIVSKIEEQAVPLLEETVMVKKLKKELAEYTSLIPYASNSLVNIIKDVISLNDLTDIIAIYVNVDNKRLIEYLKTNDPLKRAEMLLTDIFEEKELYQVEKELDVKLKKELDNNQKEFFLREKIKLIKEELGDENLDNEFLGYEKKLEDLKANNKVKDTIKKSIKRLERIPNNSPEVSVERNYIEWMLDLPWNIYTKDNDDLIEVKQKLDATHEGLEKVKTRIIEYLAIKQLTNCLRGPILCLVGPPGVGKTSLAFSIANAMNRKFVKISVGGINDEAEIIGHRKTYIGANPGRIISSIKKAGSSNPVFLIDEIDKMITNFKGDPASVLLSVLDPEQNKYFSDNYIEEEYDLSKVMFIATANYIDDIPEALRDRLEIVYLSGYTEYEKLDIAKNYLLPKICREHGINYKCVILKDEIILKIIRNYTKESGVRELERLLATIVRKIITSLSVNRIMMNKFVVDSKKLKEYLGVEIYEFNKIKTLDVGVVNGLAYTTYGGDVLPIEVSSFKGKGEITLTGSLGNVMKESAIVALNYIKANHKYFNIEYDKLINNDIHIHVPNGAIKKDGPSAGIALTTAIISLFTNKKINKEVALTGEITLKGNVLPIGGLKEKSIGALRSGVKKIYIPNDNLKDLEEMPIEVKEEITFVPVKNYKEIYKDWMRQDDDKKENKT